MSFRPLKNKKWYDGLDGWFLYNDVRSAVLGLKNELRDRRISLGLFDEQYNMIFKLIDEWFEDVIE